MLKSVAVVTRAWLSRPRKPYPFSSTILPSLINASATPETLSIDMRRSIRSSAAGRSAAGTECDLVTTATATQTAHAASRRPLQLRIIIFGPIITIRFWREGAPCAADLARMKPGRVPLAAACGGSLSAASSPHRRPLSAPCCRWQRAPAPDRFLASRPRAALGQLRAYRRSAVLHSEKIASLPPR